MHDPFIIGVDIGGTKCAVSIPATNNQVHEISRFPTEGPQETLDRICEAVQSLRADRELTANPVFGVSCGGPLDAARGLVISPPNLPVWNQIAICDHLMQRFGGKAWLMNDANACALAEWQYGAGRGANTIVFLTMGTGMGGGLILDGRLYEGANGNAGEVGHLRLAPNGPTGFGKAGSFEGFCSGGGIAQLARMRLCESTAPSLLRTTSAESLSARHVGEAADAGDRIALHILAETGERLGQGLSMIIDMLNPERIIIGSIYARCERHIAPAMWSTLRKEALSHALEACSVLPAALGDTIGSFAAVAIARYKLTQNS